MQRLVTDIESMPVLDVERVVALEKQVEASGTSLLTLMMRAGEALAQVACDMLGQRSASAVVLCGSGNNGGDGWVAAEQLARRGHRVTIITRDGAHAIKATPARLAANMVTGGVGTGNVGILLLVNPQKPQARAVMEGADLLIDCILGTGFAYDCVREPYATWIELANETSRALKTPVLSADVPSGLYAQTGLKADHCVIATGTVTMIAAKPGLVSPAARDAVGELTLATLGVDPDVR